MATMKQRFFAIISLVVGALWACALVNAEPATVMFKDCFSGKDEQKMTVSSVYAQVLDKDDAERHLNLTVIGDTPQQIVGWSDTDNNETRQLSALRLSLFR
jgi:hypothetical protein